MSWQVNHILSEYCGMVILKIKTVICLSIINVMVSFDSVSFDSTGWDEDLCWLCWITPLGKQSWVVWSSALSFVTLFIKFYLKFKSFWSSRCIWKRQQNVSHFVMVLCAKGWSWSTQMTTRCQQSVSISVNRCDAHLAWMTLGNRINFSNGTLIHWITMRQLFGNISSLLVGRMLVFHISGGEEWCFQMESWHFYW